MKWYDRTEEQLDKLKNTPVDPILAKQILSYVDLTSLNDADNKQTIINLCQKAVTSAGNVAAVCVYPKFVEIVVEQLKGTKIKIASVANFPRGTREMNLVAEEIKEALQAGAQEMDVVFPYVGYMAGDHNQTRLFIETCKAACGDEVLLKVILETGVLHNLAIIADAAQMAIEAGADFIKTSTGKIAQGATLEAAATILLVIKDLLPTIKRTVGFKVSGGIRDVETATEYLLLAQQILGSDYVSPNTFRIGASQLVDEILAK